jgi:hypothetical protein
MQILKNANNAAAAPESEVRQITNYVSTTGAFTTAAFSQVVEADDICLILHESQVATIAPTADLATDGRVAYVVGLKADTVAGNSLVSLVKKTIAALLFPTLNLATDLTTAQVIGQKADTIAGTSLVSIARIQKAETVLIKAKTDYLPTKITKTQTFVNTAAATIDLFTVTGTVDIELCAVVKTNVESAAGCNIKVDCGALAIIANSDCTTLEAADIWFANTPTTSVVALDPPSASFALSPVKKFRITNGQDITMTIEAAKQVDSGVIDYYVKWEAVSADGAVVAAA